MPKGKNKKHPRSNEKKKKSGSRNERRNQNDSSFARGSANNPAHNQGMYYTYKLKTQSFRDRIQRLLPKSIRLKSVSDLSQASDLIFDQAVASLDGSHGNDNSNGEVKNNKNSVASMNFAIPHEIIKDLDESIRLRSEVGKRFVHNTDDGHAFMLSTLEYCRKKLKQARSIIKIKGKSTQDSVRSITDTQQSDELNSDSNRFERLADSDDEEGDGKDGTIITEDMIKEGTFPTLSPPAEPKENYSIEEDLIQGSDRFQACTFLVSIERHMELVSRHFESLKEVMRNQSDEKNSMENKQKEDAHLLLLLKILTAANMAIESVQNMEAALATDRPHLSNFYNIIAVVFLSDYIDAIEKMMNKREHENDYLVKRFVGKIVEIVFHNKGGDDELDRVVKNFVRKSKLPFENIYYRARLIRQIVYSDTVTTVEEKLNFELLALYSKISTPRSWLGEFHFIGGDRSILNTQKIAQQTFDIISSRGKIIKHSRVLGDLWIEDEVPAKRVRGDLDEFLVSGVLPELVFWCMYGYSPLKLLPNNKELLTMMSLIRAHVEKNFNKSGENLQLPVSISLTFGLHVMLISIFTLQGNGDVKRLAKCTEKSFKKMFEQYDEASKSYVVQNIPIIRSKMATFKKLQYMVKPLGTPVSDKSEQYAFWNPVVGGQLLLFATYSINLALGATVVDCIGQLRITLHLYNALKENELIQDDEGLLVKLLHNVFEKSRVIWVGSRSVKGEFEKKYIISAGAGLEEAVKRSKVKFKTFSPETIASCRYTQTRKLEKILPGQMSASFIHVVKRGFSKDIDSSISGYTEEEQKQINQPFIDFVSRLKVAQDSMTVDDDVNINIRPVNLVKVAVICHEFVIGFCQAMGWDDEIEKAVVSARKSIKAWNLKDNYHTSYIRIKYTTRTLFVEQFLKYLDSFNNDSKETNDIVPFCDHDKAARFMIDFFKNLPEESYRYFYHGVEEIQKSRIQVMDLTTMKFDKDKVKSFLEWNSKALQSRNEGKLDLELVQLVGALSRYDENVMLFDTSREIIHDLWCEISLIYFKYHLFDYALDFATKAVQINPFHSLSLLRRAMACYGISSRAPKHDLEILKRAMIDLTKCEFTDENSIRLQNQLILKVSDAMGTIISQRGPMMTAVTGNNGARVCDSDSDCIE